MKKKIIALVVIAALIAIATISFVRGNIDEQEAFAGEQLGTDLADNPANEGLGQGDRHLTLHSRH